MALMRADQVGPLAHASTMSLGIGGSESNVAIGLARLGVQSVWCGRVGADSLGQLVEREIRAEGVDVRIAVDATASTGLMIKERRTPATQRVSYYRAGSAGSRISSRGRRRTAHLPGSAVARQRNHSGAVQAGRVNHQLCHRDGQGCRRAGLLRPQFPGQSLVAGRRRQASTGTSSRSRTLCSRATTKPPSPSGPANPRTLPDG